MGIEKGVQTAEHDPGPPRPPRAPEKHYLRQQIQIDFPGGVHVEFTEDEEEMIVWTDKHPRTKISVPTESFSVSVAQYASCSSASLFFKMDEAVVRATIVPRTIEEDAAIQARSEKKRGEE